MRRLRRKSSSLELRFSCKPAGLLKYPQAEYPSNARANWRFVMLNQFKLIFKDFKKASKYAQIYNKHIQNPFINKEIKTKTYIWVEKILD